MSVPTSLLTAAAAAAARNDDVATLRSALQHISENARFEGDRPLLHFACQGQGHATAALLLERGADVLAKVHAPVLKVNTKLVVKCLMICALRRRWTAAPRCMPQRKAATRTL
jgi:hypothetical protein